MPRGGKRPGAGRPKGSKNRLTKKRLELAQKAAHEGVTPLEVQLETMREIWDKATKRGKIVDLALAREACEIARMAAPFVHPKLNAVDHTGDMTMRHEDLLRELED